MLNDTLPHAGPEGSALPSFSLVAPADLAHYWPWVLRGLAEVKRRIYGRATYEPAHVRHAILQGQAFLYVAQEDDVNLGFTVLTIQNDPFLLVPTVLHVWILYVEPCAPFSVTRFIAREILALGRKLCLSSVNFMSPRANEKAWQRALGVPEGQLRMAVYQFDLFAEAEQAPKGLPDHTMPCLAMPYHTKPHHAAARPGLPQPAMPNHEPVTVTGDGFAVYSVDYSTEKAEA